MSETSPNDPTARCDPQAEIWLHASMECIICTRPWEAVYPVFARQLECPGCGYMNPAPEQEGQK